MSESEQDNRGPAIIAYGSVISGYKFIGPFETIDAACDWWRTSLYGVLEAPITIALLEKPREPSPLNFP